MTIDSKLAKQSRRNKNQHYRSKLNPRIQELIEILRRSWGTIGLVDRGQRINRLVSAGCSNRGLGRELGVSETSIRRHAEIAELPESDRKAIDAGESAKRILLAKKAAALRRERLRRVDQDMRTGALSNEIASIILEFCRTRHGLKKQPITKAMLPTFLDNVGSYLRKFEQTALRTLKAPKELEPRELFRKTRPRAAKNTPAMVYQAEWLAEALWLIAPETPIRASALVKARKRTKELLPRRTLPEMIEDAAVNSAVRMFELTHQPSRKEHPGGARAFMQRQGPASPSDHPDGLKNKDFKP